MGPRPGSWLGEGGTRGEALAVTLVASVTLLVVISAVALSFGSPRANTNVPPVNAGNGTSFGQAFAPANRTANATQGGPWRLVSALGLYTTLPFTPILYPLNDSLNQTYAACGSLPGVTIWNASAIPVGVGSASQGYAAFWSFIYLNSSSSSLVVTYLNNQVRSFGPLAPSSPCGRLLARLNPVYPTIPAAAPTADYASGAWEAEGAAFAQAHRNFAAQFVIGWSQTDAWADPFYWNVNYYQCGLAGFSGDGTLSVAETNLTTGKVIATLTQGENCNLLNYTMHFSPVQVVNDSGTATRFDVTALQLEDSFPNRTGPNVTTNDGWGLDAWMTQLRLTSPAGTPLAMASPSCTSWVVNYTQCRANQSGWYAVLVNANGGWLDSFGGSGSSGSWTVPNVPYTSHEQLVIVVPESLSTTGCVVEPISLISSISLTGSVAL